MAENEILRERIAILESELMETHPLPIEWRLTGQESRVFGALVNRELATKESIMAALYYDRVDSEGAEQKIVDVFVCKMRKKLKLFAIEITTVWGQGYMLDAATRTQFRKSAQRAAA